MAIGDPLTVLPPGQNKGPEPIIRRRLWQLPLKLHCPIVGICSNVAKQKEILRR